jgi:rhodanese-related sulfurtransferase
MLGIAARAAALLTLGVALGWVVNAVRPGGLRPGQFAAATTCSAGGAVASGAGPAVEVLAPVQAMRACGDAGALIVDVRPAERYAAGHVAGAVHLPCAAGAEASSGPLARLAGKHTVIVYGDSTAEAAPVAEALRARLDPAPAAAGRVVVIDGGFAAWDGAGLACTSGPCQDCRDGLAKLPVTPASRTEAPAP